MVHSEEDNCCEWPVRLAHAWALLAASAACQPATRGTAVATAPPDTAAWLETLADLPLAQTAAQQHCCQSWPPPHTRCPDLLLSPLRPHLPTVDGCCSMHSHMRRPLMLFPATSDASAIQMPCWNPAVLRCGSVRCCWQHIGSKVHCRAHHLTGLPTAVLRGEGFAAWTLQRAAQWFRPCQHAEAGRRRCRLR